MKYYMSSSGEVRSEQYWREWALELYDFATDIVPIPKDWWERTMTVLKLKEVDSKAG